MVLAAFKYLSRRNESVAQNDTPGAQVDEQTPLLSEEDREAEAAIQSNEDEVDIISDTKVDEASATRELVIARVGLIIEALGVLALWESWNALEINIGNALLDPAWSGRLMTLHSDHDRLLRSAFICVFAGFGHYGRTTRRDRTSFGGPIHFRVASCRPAQSRFLPALPGYARKNAWSDMVASCSESS